MKKWMLGIFALSFSFFSQASLMTIITGADMKGMDVTVTFEGGSQETKPWIETGAEAGGAFSTDWSLALTGKTFGDYDKDTNTFYGLWTFSNLSASKNIIGLSINAAVANVYFDILEGIYVGSDASGAGRPFDADVLGDIDVAFTDEFSAPDLFGTLAISWKSGLSLEAQQVANFITDTDKFEVPEPAYMFVFGLLALMCLRNKKA